MRLRSVSVLSVAGAYVAWVALAAAQPIAPPVLKKLHDPAWTVRAEPVAQLTADPQMLQAWRVLARPWPRSSPRYFQMTR